MGKIVNLSKAQATKMFQNMQQEISMKQSTRWKIDPKLAPSINAFTEAQGTAKTAGGPQPKLSDFLHSALNGLNGR